MITPMESPPEGLLPWIREQTDIQWEDYLIYRAGRWTNPLTGIKEKCVDAVCTACGQSMKLKYVAGPECGLYASAPFGFGWYDDGEYCEAKSYSDIHCPMCGAKVQALHIGHAAATERFAWPMTLEARGAALILYLWRVRRRADKTGFIHWDVIPYEAYVYDQGKAVKWVHWTRTMGGSTCILQKWESRQKLTDTAFDINIVYCPEGIERACMGTCMENSKLAEYMAIESEYRFPVTWLRLYQRYPNLENLMTCQAAKLTAGMIAEEKRAASYYRQWNSNTDMLRAMARTKARPWDILRIQKDELAYFTEKEKKDGAERLKTVQIMRKAGYRVRAGEEDPVWIKRDLKSFLENGFDPRKVQRYIVHQRRRYPKDNAGYYMLSDYWSAAEYLHMDLNDPELRWPQRLKNAHDDATGRRQELMDRERKKMAAEKATRRAAGFEKRYTALSRYSWERDGILIRPARTEQELKDEGKKLHHCVGTYADSHVEGRSSIFFIRRASDQDQPWYTLNLDDKSLTVKMNLGNHNCKTTDEVKAFEEAWIAWVRAGAKQKKKEVNAA